MISDYMQYHSCEPHSAQALLNTQELVEDMYTASSQGEGWMDDYFPDDEPQDNGWMDDLVLAV